MDRTCIVLPGLLAVLSAPGLAQPTFTEVPAANTFILSWSGDGRVGAGVSAGNAAGNMVDGFRWTSDGGLANIGGYQAYGIIVSRDGKTIVGHILNSQGFTEAAIWQGGKNWQPLGGFPGQAPDPETKILNTALGVSADGSVIVGAAQKGTSTSYAYRWDARNGMVLLGSFTDRGSQAVGISADGNTIIGWDYNQQTSYPYDHREGVIFWQGTERRLHPFGWAGTPFAANQVGSILVGIWGPANAYSQPGHTTTYRYTAWDGRFEDLGAVSTGNPLVDLDQYSSQPSALSDDGEVIGGTTGRLAGEGASLWTRATGMVRLQEWLTSQGVTAHQGWRLLETYHVSPDGKFIAGIGIKPQLGADVGGSWVVTLRCRSDKTNYRIAALAAHVS